MVVFYSCHFHPAGQTPSPGEQDLPLALTAKPTLPQLTHVHIQDRQPINIMERIGGDYNKLGTMLLNDDDGSKKEGIAANQPQRITENILSTWLKGGGKQPVTWDAFITTLKKVGLTELAKDIKEQVMEHGDNVHSSAPHPISIPPSAKRMKVCLCVCNLFSLVHNKNFGLLCPFMICIAITLCIADRSFCNELLQH